MQFKWMRSNNRENNSERAEREMIQKCNTNLSTSNWKQIPENKNRRERKKRTRTTTETIHIQTDKSNEQCEIESLTRPIKWNKINNEEKEKSALDLNQNAEQRGNNTHTKITYFVFLFMVRSFILKKTLKSFDKVAKYYIIIICVCVCCVPWYLQSECKRTFSSDKYSHNSFSIFNVIFGRDFFYALSLSPSLFWVRLYQHTRNVTTKFQSFFSVFSIKKNHKERNATQKYSRKSYIKRSQVVE